jgi:hypothetical protein
VRENWAPAFFVGDFTVSVEVFVEEPLDDAPGDILGFSILTPGAG